jgi:hypothetical protein
MIRFLYGQVLRMHPSAFRRRFSAEMLLAFDEAVGSEGAFVLLADCLASLMRQWFLRSRLWVAILAIAGALLGFMALLRLPRAAFGRVLLSANSVISVPELLIAVAVIAPTLVAITAIGVWNFRSLRKRGETNMISSPGRNSQ